jgi:uncharacterized membrane protein YjgN (DUF898 family)
LALDSARRLFHHRNRIYDSWAILSFSRIFGLDRQNISTKVNRNSYRLKCYLFLLSILFLLELVATIIVFALGDQIIDAVAEKTSTTEQIQQLKDYLFAVNYFVIGTLVIELLLIMFVYCYIGSLRNTNQEYDYRIVDSEGKKFTVEEKQQNDKNKIQEKYAKKR